MHIAKHLRRTAYPPESTWVAIGGDKRGYKKYPHFQIGINEHYVFFTLAVGLTCGMGYIGYAVIFTVILSALMFILDIINFGSLKGKSMQLKITVPEDLNYEGVFEEVLSEFATSYTIERVRTRDFGALFELYYRVQLKPDANQKKFLDKLRCRNGNLNINLTMAGFEDKAYN